MVVAPHTNQQAAQQTSQLPIVNNDDFLPPTHRWLSWTGFMLAGALLALAGLSSVIKYEVAVKANAVFRPQGESKIVQSALEGTVDEILVQKNQRVERGEVIARLEDTQLQSQHIQLESALLQLQAQERNVLAQKRSLDDQIAARQVAVDATARVAVAELAQRERDYQDKAQAADADVEAAQANLELALDQYQRYQSLLEKGAIAAAQVQEKASAVTVAQGELIKAQAATSPTTASLTVARAQIEQQRAEGNVTLAALQKEHSGLNQQQSQLQAQITSTLKDLALVEQQLQKTTIRATAEGTIFTLNLRNAGQVVLLGEQLVQIVSSNAPLSVKANVATQDIHKLKVGQRANLKVTACSYSDYGTLPGTVSHIAADATTSEAQESSQTQPYFEVIIEPEAETFGSSNATCLLKAGMDATASIITEQDTVLRFLLRKARLVSEL